MPAEERALVIEFVSRLTQNLPNPGFLLPPFIGTNFAKTGSRPELRPESYRSPAEE